MFLFWLGVASASPGEWFSEADADPTGTGSAPFAWDVGAYLDFAAHVAGSPHDDAWMTWAKMQDEPCLEGIAHALAAPRHPEAGRSAGALVATCPSADAFGDLLVGRLWWRIGNAEEAHAAFRRGRSRSSAGPTLLSEAWLLDGMVHAARDLHDRAVRDFARAVAAAEDGPREARAWLHLGSSLDAEGDGPRAREAFARSGDLCGEDACRANAGLAVAESLLHEHRHVEAAVRAGALRTSRLAGRAALVEGSALFRLGRTQEARDVVSGARGPLDPLDRLRADVLLGRIALSEGDREGARSRLEGRPHALSAQGALREALDAELLLNEVEPRSLRALASFVQQADRLDDPSLRLQSRLAWVRAGGDRSSSGRQSRVLADLASVLDEALLGHRGPNAYAEALSVRQRDVLHRSALALHRLGDDDAAFGVLAALQARSLRDAFVDNRAMRGRRSEPGIDATYEGYRAAAEPEIAGLTARVAGIRERLIGSQVRATDVPTSDVSPLRELVEVRARLASTAMSVGKTVQRRRLRTPHLSNEVMPTLEALERTTDASVRMIAWHPTSDGLLVELVTPGDYRLKKVPVAVEALRRDAAAVLDAMGQIARARGRARDRLLAAFPDASLNDLSRALIDPVRPWLPAGSTLFLAPEGFLHGVPFAALPGRSGAPLVSTHDVLVVPASTWPVFDAMPPPFDGRGVYTEYFAGSSFAVKAHAMRSAIVVADEVAGLPALQFASSEADAVEARLAGIGPVERLCATCATPPTAAQVLGRTAQVDILHVIAHAVGESSPALSELGAGSLAHLWLGTPRGRDRVWEHQLEYPPLGADLVVLSACRTGLADRWSLEGGFGLTRALLGAGARSVVSSLWAVDDAATAALMTRFYEDALAGPRWKVRGLAEAQRAIAAEPETAHPFFWAAFQLHGAPGTPVEWSP